MIARRSVLLGAAASFTVSGVGLAQVLAPAGYGAPLGTSPFAPDVFRARRAKVMAALGTGVAVIYGADAAASGAAVQPRFAQDSDFAWLTGIVDEPGAILVLAPTERDHREFLLLPSRNPEIERWDIERLPLGNEIEQRTGFARVLRTTMLGALVTTLTAHSKALRFLGPIVGTNAPVPRPLDLYDKVMQRVPGCTLRDDSALLPSLRIVKEQRELELIRRATAATRAGHLAAMRAVRPGMTERQLTDVLEAAFRAAGGDGLSYDSIVGSGRNAASLHYVRAAGPIADGHLVLIDAAASVGGYACDVTRTFPANGRFTPEQRQTYDLVLAAQDAAVAKLRAGAYYQDLSETAKDVFRKAGRIDDFYHGLGHYVGLDVHDPGDTSRPIPAGAVITVEPGLYVQSAGYGIRIEDLYVVTPNGAERLSTGIPRTAAEIETFMAQRG